MNAMQAKRHQCGKAANGRAWQICTVCDGRMHLTGCTARMDPAKDCCTARHKMLFEQGQTVGLNDSSQPMWDDLWAGLESEGKQVYWQ